MGACIYVFAKKPLTRIYLSGFKSKEINECKERLREINLNGIPINQRVRTYVLDKKIQSFSPEIITEAERIYFNQKQIDDLVSYISVFEFSFDEVFHKRFKIFKKLNKNQRIVKTLIEHNWTEKSIIQAFKIIERGRKQSGKSRIKPSLPRLKGEIEQDLKESSANREDSRDDRGTRGITRTSSNESTTTPNIPRELA